MGGTAVGKYERVMLHRFNLSVLRMHFSRLWCERHAAEHVRNSLRSNIRGQRAAKAGIILARKERR